MIRHIILYSLFSMIFLVSNISFSCNCVGNISAKKEIKTSDVVFKGKVIEKSLFVVDTLFANEYVYKAKYKIELDIVYKGKKIKNKYVTVITGVGNGDCGYEFKKGENYIVYAKLENKYYPKGDRVSTFLYTDICKRTTNKVNKEEKTIMEYRKSCKWKKNL